MAVRFQVPGEAVSACPTTGLPVIAGAVTFSTSFGYWSRTSTASYPSSTWPALVTTTSWASSSDGWSFQNSWAASEIPWGISSKASNSTR